MCTSCNCGTQTTDTIDTTPPVSIDATSYTVSGMTCGHCVTSVTEEVGAIDGVRDVHVDLASGVLTFTSDEPVARDTVEAAVREAGYALA
ncbi:hypothetical protein GCM10011492_12190 [Flexivirga endophytica]|uniref:HMA domain-containing protein n=1 Tax=Flexivirga endophytica TaxID=1849103 RepID=A0A916T166_9MICO|nr:heavy-metal-associated domain-containing protein [Flexivirga endophytica]GGB23852.1 hypothetical protein GCM10011492_12190 [Flexivirga endophytica]GHB57811.1 hypothetical protein GCM10008112_28730 [Flexivirga endophytica]